MVTLNVGCGAVRCPDEIGVDIMRTPAVEVVGSVRALPFLTNSVDRIRLDHVLEHQPQRYALITLAEIYRVLKPDGFIRVGVPDLRAVCDLYVNGELGLYDKALIIRNLYGSQVHDGEFHRSGWDKETLSNILTAVGFRNVVVMDDIGRGDGMSIYAEGTK